MHRSQRLCDTICVLRHGIFLIPPWTNWSILRPESYQSHAKDTSWLPKRTRRRKMPAKLQRLLRNLPQNLPWNFPCKSPPEPQGTHSTGFPIVRLGASAGGLEAFEQFFRNVPPDSGMAFVLVSHLDPDHVSILTEILQRTTTMSVVEARDQMLSLIHI